MDDKIKRVGNVRMVDPADLLDGGSVDQSDLFIYATLKARIKTKSFVTQNEEKEISISFLKNKDTNLGEINSSFLSTNWTNIGGPENLGEDLETFGMENIEISVNAGFIPTVSIDFIDIRGATLFEQGDCSPYSAFFQQPYPIFELTIKGYYGSPIKYYLAIKSFNTSFDPSSGNYKSKGEFIGYTYAFLSDILLGYIMAAPYMDGAKEKLKNIYTRYLANYDDMGYNKNPNRFEPNSGNEPMTLHSYINKIKDLKSGKKGGTSILDTIGNSKELQKVQEINKLSDLLSNTVLELVTDLFSDLGSKNQEPTSVTYQNTEDNKSLYDLFLANLGTNIGVYNDTVGSVFSSESATLTINYDDLVSKIKKTTSNSQTTLDTTEFKQYIDNKLKEINKVREDAKNELTTRSNDAIKTSIGFIPTIRSFFTVLIANTELLLELILEASVKGEKYHDESEDKIPFNKDDVSVKDVFYAWPKYNEKIGNNYVEKYPGIQFPNWPEVKFIEDFYLALQKSETKNNEDDLDLSKLNDAPGRDNYMAINALETPAGSLDTHNSYYNLQTPKEINKTIGERFIVLTNMTNLNEVNLSQSIIYQGSKRLSGLMEGNYFLTSLNLQKNTKNDFITVTPILKTLGEKFPYYSINLYNVPEKFNTDDAFLKNINQSLRSSNPSKNIQNLFDSSAPILNTKVSELNNSLLNSQPSLNVSKPLVNNFYNLGQVEAHNLIDSLKDNSKVLTSIVNGSKDPKKLKKDILDVLNITGNDIGLDQYYTAYRYNKDIVFNDKSVVGEKPLKTLKPNIHDMEGESLFKIYKDKNGNPELFVRSSDLTKDSPVLLDVVNGSSVSNAFNQNNFNFGIEALGQPDSENFGKEGFPIWTKIGFQEISDYDSVEWVKPPPRIFNLLDNKIETSLGDIKTPYISNMLVNPWQGAFTTINYGNDRSVTSVDDLPKTSNFASQSLLIASSRSILEVYPDYLFPYHLDGFKNVVGLKSVQDYGDIPFRYRENGAIELTNFGMYNRVPRSKDGDYTTDSCMFNRDDNSLNKQIIIKYSSEYKKPFNIDPTAEDTVKTLDNLKSLREIDGPSGDGVDYISVGLDSKLQYNGGFSVGDLTPDDKYWTEVFKTLEEIGFIEKDSENISGISSGILRSWSGFIEDITNLNDEFNTDYLAGPNDDNNKLKWFVAYQPDYDPDQTAFRILTTSKTSTFENFYSQTIAENYTYKKWNSSIPVGDEWDEIYFGIIGGIIEPELETNGNKKSLTLKIPKNNDFDEFIEKKIEPGPLSSSLLEKFNNNLSLKVVGNQLNTGSILTESPFWRHNFPAPTLGSNIGKTNDGDNSTVYYSYWGGKYFLYSDKNKVGTHLPLGVRFDLDSWDNTSDLMRGGNSGIKTILTTHNKEGFVVKQNPSGVGFIDSRKHKTNYNRSKNWKGSLAYLWLANHYHRPWTGTYTNTDRFYGPQQTLGTASIVASIPKASLLLLGAVLWRMRESGLLISDSPRWDIEPKNGLIDDKGKYLDPINIPTLPKTLDFNNGYKFDTERFGLTINKTIISDNDNDTYEWNNGVRPPLASLMGFGEFFQIDNEVNLTPVVDHGGIISCFPRADEWPTLNLGMLYVYDFFKEKNAKNPFTNQYKIWAPFFTKNGALMQKFPNQVAVWITRQQQLDKFQKDIDEAVKELANTAANFNFKVSEKVNQSGGDAITDANNTVINAVNQINILENLIQESKDFTGADESFSKFVILQHDLNRCVDRRSNNIKDNDNQNPLNTDFGRSSDTVLNRDSFITNTPTSNNKVEEIVVNSYFDLYSLYSDKKWNNRVVLKIEGVSSFDDDFIIDTFTANTTTQIDVGGQTQTINTIESKLERRSLIQKNPFFTTTPFKGTKDFDIKWFRPDSDPTKVGIFGYLHEENDVEEEKVKLFRFLVEPKSGREYKKLGIKLKIVFEDSNQYTEPPSNVGLPLRSDYLRGYTPIGPELWFLPTSVKNIIIELFEDYVGDFNNFQGNAEGTSGSDFDKVLATIDPLNFPNPKGEGITNREYPNTLKGDMTPNLLKSINETSHYNLPLVDKADSEPIQYPEPLKRWEKTYTKTAEGNPKPVRADILTQIINKDNLEKKIPDKFSNNQITYKIISPTTFNIVEDSEIFKKAYEGELISEYIVANATPRTWWGEFALDGSNNETEQKYFYFNQSELDNFIHGFSEVFNSPSVKDLVDNKIKGSLSVGDLSDNDIKLSLYNSIKSIYDKWISSSEGNDINNPKLFFNPISSSGNSPRLLIDHFSFVNRINGDIGDKAVVDLETILTIRNNTQNSVFGVTSDVLDKSNFLFHALPAYVDISKGLSKAAKDQNNGTEAGDNVLKKMFTPQTTSDVFNDRTFGGPHFLCMYVGGNSQVLELGKNSQTNCLSSGKQEKMGDSGSIPDTIGEDEDPNSVGVVAFKVKFGHQNQNHFLSVNLDQAEYKNTNESLLATEAISRVNQDGGSGGLVFKSQSLYDIFLNRSYSCTVESMGNMMIQPLQYFELENVPMFYGSYLIRDVKHSVKPHDIKTTFVGDRVPQTTIPIIEDVLTLFNITSESEGKTTLGGGSNFIGSTSRFNPADYTDIENKLIEVTPIGTVTTNPPNAQTISKLWRLPSGGQTIPNKDAAIAVTAMVEAAAKDGIKLTISSGFRPATGTGDDLKWIDTNGKTGTFTTQETLRRNESNFIKTSKDYIKFVDGSGSEDRPNYYGLKEGKEAFIFYASSESYNPPTAPIGKSEHGSGIAVDFNTGGRKNFTPLIKDNYVWMAKNSYKYGFIRTVSSEEWHFEYRPEEAVNGPYAKVKPGSGGKLENNGWYADLGLDNLTVQTDLVGFDGNSDISNSLDFTSGKKYVDNLKTTQKNNIKIIVEKLKEKQITQPFAIAAILSIVSKESNLEPISENFTYSAKRITEVWPSFFDSEQQVIDLGLVNPTTKKADTEDYQKKLANYVYGEKSLGGNRTDGYGNGKEPSSSIGPLTDDGWNFRGRGFNQVTFKGNYIAQKGYSGIDLVNNPNLLSQSNEAAIVLSSFMEVKIKELVKNKKITSYGATGANDFPDIENAVFAYYHCNTGTGKSVKTVKNKLNDNLGGMNRAQSRAPYLLEYIKNVGLV